MDTKALLTTFNDVRYLDISQNNIHSLIKPFKMPLLLLLNISSNNLTKISHNSFQGMFNLRYLYLQHNFLKSLTSEIFSGISRSVEILNISSNQLDILEAGAFTGLDHISFLDLRANGIMIIQPGVFSQQLKCQHILSHDERFQCFSMQTPSQHKTGYTCLTFFNSGLSLYMYYIEGNIIIVLNTLTLVHYIALLINNKSLNLKSGTLVFIRINRVCSLCLLGLYMLTIACIATYFEGGFVYLDIWWKNSFLCLALNIASNLALTMNPLLGMINEVAMRRKVSSKPKWDNALSWWLVLVIAILWLAHLAIIVVSHITINYTENKHCIFIFSGSFKYKIVHQSITTLYNMLHFLLSAFISVINILQIHSSMKSCQRYKMSITEKYFFFKLFVALILTLQTTIATCMLFCIHLTYLSFSPGQKEHIIHIGFYLILLPQTLLYMQSVFQSKNYFNLRK